MKNKESKKHRYGSDVVGSVQEEIEKNHRQAMTNLRLTSEVLDTTPLDKKQKKDLLDIVEEIKMLARDDDRNPPPITRDDNPREPNMVGENIVRSLPDMGKQQLDYLKKEYAKKAEKIKKEKIDQGKELDNSEQIVMLTYKSIKMEYNRRMQAAQKKEQITTPPPPLMEDSRENKPKTSTRR